LEQLGLLSPMMATTSYWLGSAILLAAGVWQLTPIKSICLRHCRSPMGFLVQRWRPGRLGAFRMGLEHGSYCLGCCWFLMGLLFFGGIMNLFWIIGLAIFILLEKTIPMGSWIGRIVGFGVAGWGAVMFATTTLTIAAPDEYRFEAAEVPFRTRQNHALGPSSRPAGQKARQRRRYHRSQNGHGSERHARDVWYRGAGDIRAVWAFSLFG
jgi:hypothetical protein